MNTPGFLLAALVQEKLLIPMQGRKRSHEPVSFVPEDRRMDVVEGPFETAFPLQLEPVVYGTTDRMAEDYTGGYWHFYTFSNGGFYMTPAEHKVFHVKCQNIYEEISLHTPWA